jgi:hypothetical protein
MNTQQSHVKASRVEEWFRSLGDFSAESVTPLEVNIASIDIQEHNM